MVDTRTRAVVQGYTSGRCALFSGFGFSKIVKNSKKLKKKILKKIIFSYVGRERKRKRKKVNQKTGVSLCCCLLLADDTPSFPLLEFALFYFFLSALCRH
jgi:hypothetical protein